MRLALVLAALVLFACESARAPTAEASSAREARAGAGERLVKKQGWQSVEVADLGPALEAARLAASDAGGRVESEARYSDERATLVLRVPSATLDSVLGRLAALGQERSRRVMTEDVTESHADLEIQLRNKGALRDRLRALAERAKDVNEVLQVERELARVQAEVESLQGQLERLNRDVEQTRLEVSFERAHIYGPLGYFFRGLYWGVARLFVIR